MSDTHRAPGDHTRLFADRYHLGPVVGRGGMADVVRATDRVLGREVAVKLFRSSDADVAESRRIDSEMRTLASLSHPALVTLFDAGRAPDDAGVDTAYLVMEFVDGPTLGGYRAGAALPPSEVARIGREMAAALAHIHAANVVHRDVKPGNIMVPLGSEHRTTAKLTDFGISRVVDAQRLTEHGAMVGTAHYFSPEQATGAPVGPPSDVYSLGLVLLECLTGRMVFEGSAVAAAVARLHRDPVVPPELGPDWSSLLTAMTRRRPADRPSAAHVAGALAALEREPAATAVLAAIPPRRRGLGWIAAAALTGVAALVAVAVWAGSPSSAPASEPTPPSSTADPVLTEAPAAVVPEAEPTAPAVTEPPAPTIEPAPAPAPEAPAVVAPIPAPAPVTAEPGTAPGNSGNSNGNGNSGGNGNGNSGNNGNGNGNGNR